MFPQVPPNLKLRRMLEKKSTGELFKMLKKLDKNRARNIDAKNPRRLIRAIEIATTMKRVPKLVACPITSNNNILFIGLKPNDEVLRKKIKLRLDKRLKATGKNNLITEVKKLRKDGLSWKRLEALGLEYHFVALFLQKRLTKSELPAELEKASWHYTKRQMTWFKKDKRIRWFENSAKVWKDSEVQYFLR